MSQFNRKKFFAGFRERIDSTIEQEQVDGVEFLLHGFEQDMRWADIRHIAYALATIFHETAGSMQPVEEGYYLGSRARVQRFQKTLRYFPYFGRGYIQLTWKKNYETAGKTLGLDLVNQPELALDSAHAFRILTEGLFRGWFGAKLTTHINDKKTDYVNARRCVNILDKAGLIAGYAKSFERILKDSATDKTTGGGSAVNTTTDKPLETSLEPAAPLPIPPPVVVEKETEKGFFEGIKMTVAGWWGTIGGLEGVRQVSGDATAFGVSGGDILQKIVIALIIAFVLWICYRGLKHIAAGIKSRILTAALVNANGTPGQVIVAEADKLADLEKQGWVAVRRQ